MIRLEQEIWKDIKGYEGLYQVSNLGRVKSLERQVWNRFQMINKPEKILKPRKNSKGYISYILYKNGVGKSYRAHRLTLTTFVKNVQNKPMVNHKDGQKDNNHLSNLEYNTNSENIIHALEHGLYKDRKRRYKFNKQDPKKCLDKYREIALKKARDINSKVVYQYDMSGNLIKEWENTREAERFYGKRIHIERGKALGYIWKRKDDVNE